jgi:GAF domain-containing protein
LGVAAAQVWSLNKAEQALEPQASSGPDLPLDGAHSQIRVGEHEVGRVARDRKPHLTNAAGGDPAGADRDGAVAFAGHPLVVAGRLVGVTAVFARHPLPDDIARTLGAVANSLALAVRCCQAAGEVRELRATAAALGGE